MAVGDMESIPFAIVVICSFCENHRKSNYVPQILKKSRFVALYIYNIMWRTEHVS